jgi:hypothetical protein
MSWVHKELKKRVAAGSDGQASVPATEPEKAAQQARHKIAALWIGLERLNDALPAELKLRREVGEPGAFVGLMPAFPLALVAENGACVGLVEDGIRYLWPAKNASKSNNFWVRWDGDKGYVVKRRVAGSWISPTTEEFAFDSSRLEHMLKCLVTQERIKPESLRPSGLRLPWRKR